MESAEGQISEIDFPSKWGITQGTHLKKQYPTGKSTSVDSFGITFDVTIQEIVEQTEKPWVLERMVRARALIANGKDNDYRSVAFLVGNAQQLRKFILNKSLLMLSSQSFCKILEETQAENCIYKITDVASEHFEYIVNYLHGNFIWEFITLEDACDQIEAARRYNMSGLNDEIFD
ncbi:unnamed protein product [Allacma fusca]|uniref:BTB domain-containing protein n=1 Tax=Allacma fusca TaxID=39272 RepID=A0A8J2JTZ6_9HEXA|nr:unnamed protein product [Allacma fusca]